MGISRPRQRQRRDEDASGPSEVLICVMLRQMVKKERNQKVSRNTIRRLCVLWDFQNEDDEWVKKAVATPSQEIQEEAAEEEEAEEEDPEEVEPVTEDRADDEIPVPPLHTTPAVGRSAAFGSHATRLALLEASVSDLKEQ
ncbi:hypothetical protein CJ030_MR0G006724 [Morella rubra]|uniref:Uncharacterized protein n=1 Tax=Morella rubra TaxID=262757 RepID=A0A6A1UK44_9ROSI|nr:hypothetical protein CJ030_MR0G006724 [Morella rubra]